MSDPDPARMRFAIINLLRLGGLAIALTGLVIVARRWVEPAELIGGVLVVIGIVDMVFVPAWLARKWRTPAE